jgi:trans-aconitate methyltransferase
VNALVARAVAAYGAEPRSVRLHVAARARTCPFPELEARVPATGQVLDVGCGHGLGSLVLALGGPGRVVRGVDIDDEKLPHAVAAARRAGATNVSFEAIEPGWRPDVAADAIVLVDVLYLLGREAAAALLTDLCGWLAPGGQLLVKEIDVEPRWKYQLARLQEVVATRVARITEGEQVDFVAPADIAAVLEAAGLEVEHVPLHRGRPHPHHLVAGRRPTVGA